MEEECRGVCLGEEKTFSGVGEAADEVVIAVGGGSEALGVS